MGVYKNQARHGMEQIKPQHMSAHAKPGLGAGLKGAIGSCLNYATALTGVHNDRLLWTWLDEATASTGLHEVRLGADLPSQLHPLVCPFGSAGDGP